MQKVSNEEFAIMLTKKKEEREEKSVTNKKKREGFISLKRQGITFLFFTLQYLVSSPPLLCLQFFLSYSLFGASSSIPTVSRLS